MAKCFHCKHCDLGIETNQPPYCEVLEVEINAQKIKFPSFSLPNCPLKKEMRLQKAKSRKRNKGIDPEELCS